MHRFTFKEFTAHHSEKAAQMHRWATPSLGFIGIKICYEILTAQPFGSTEKNGAMDVYFLHIYHYSHILWCSKKRFSSACEAFIADTCAWKTFGTSLKMWALVIVQINTSIVPVFTWTECQTMSLNQNFIADFGASWKPKLFHKAQLCICAPSPSVVGGKFQRCERCKCLLLFIRIWMRRILSSSFPHIS